MKKEKDPLKGEALKKKTPQGKASNKRGVSKRAAKKRTRK